MLGKHVLVGLMAMLLATACGDDDGSEDAAVLDAFDGGTDAAELDVPLPDPEIETAGGPVIGERGDGYVEFLGIPYAAPPVDDLRWRSPAPHPGWTEPVVSQQPTRCRQDAIGFGLGGDEDCLYLNVHAPDPLPADAPVMVWIHGGGFVFGEGVQLDNGTRGDLLAQRGVVVVSMNYRLGAYGYLAHPELTAEEGSSGNFGFEDQIAALEWVRTNIAVFGGNPDDVTIFGESAGGQSVCFHMISPASRGLFHKAIVESGLCDRPIETLEAAEAYGSEFATALGCDDTSCLRELSADDIDAMDPGAQLFETLNGQRSWWPVVDGTLLPAPFDEVVIADEHAKVPSLVGWNADEGTLFVMLAEQAQGREMNASDYDEFMTGLAAAQGVERSALLLQYPIEAYDDPGAAMADALGDGALACPTRRAAQLLAPTTPTWVYQFNFADAPFQLAEDRELGAFHSAEIQYVFGHPTPIAQRIFRGDQATLNETMADVWVRFARDGDLSVTTAGSAGWDTFDAAEAFMSFDVPTSAASTAPDAEVCALFD